MKMVSWDLFYPFLFIFYKLVPKKIYKVAGQLGWPKSSPTWSGDAH
jgi:hypothetical protein